MFHTFLYDASISSGAAQNVNAVTDSVFTVSNNAVIPPGDMKLFAIAAVSTTLSRARAFTPSSKVYGTNVVSPIMGASGITDPPQIMNLINQPLQLRGNEPIFCDASVGGTERTTFVMWAGNQIDPVPTGPIVQVRATHTTSLTANTWGSASLTFDDNLSTQKYAIVGMKYCGGSPRAARLILPGQVWRPGCLGTITTTKAEHLIFQTRALGVFGYFTPPAYPIVECYCSSSDTSGELYLEIVRV